MKRILQTPEGLRVVIDTKTDPVLYYSPQNPPDTGTLYTRGVDLYYHKSRRGKEYFYFFEWSMWQGETGIIRLCSREEAENFLVEKAGKMGWEGLKEKDFERLKQYGFDLLSETA